MRSMPFALLTLAAVACFIALQPAAVVRADDVATVGSAIEVPPEGFRDWKLISVAHEAGNLNDFRAVLGNDLAIAAYREGKLPFPDGAIIVRLAWKYDVSQENNKAFGREQSFVAGAPINVQFMIKDSTKYASTNGWGFAQFKDGKPDPKADLKTCSPCHQSAKANDFVFTRYAPTP